jgi:uncharacterized protein YacL
MEDELEELQSISLDELALEHLKETSKWTKFMAITSFVFLGLGLIGCLILAMVDITGKGARGMSVLPLLVLIAIYFLPMYYLFQFSILSRRAVEEQDSFTLTQALQYQKMHYRYLGILMICIFVLYVVLGISVLLFFNMRR